MPSTGKITNPDTFAARMRELRENAGLSKASAARKLGFSAQRYQRYEDGRIPDAETIMAIAAAYGVSADWLLGNGGLDAAAAAPQVRPVEPAAGAACRYPADCDLAQRLDAMQSELATVRAQMETLVGLLGGALGRSLATGEGADRKAG